MYNNINGEGNYALAA